MPGVGPGGGLVGPGGGLVGPFVAAGVGSGEIHLSGGVVSGIADAWFLHSRPFQIGGMGTLTHSRPFAIEGVAVAILHSRPFSLFASPHDTYVPPPLLSTTLAANASIGATSIVVTSAAGIYAGMFLELEGGEIVRVASSYVSGTTIPLETGLLNAYVIGDSVSQALTTAPEFLIFDKTGVLLGTLEDAYLSDAPSFAISTQGNAGFYAPRNATNLSLLKGDRLVLIGDPLGSPWAGEIKPTEWGEGKEQINLPDLFSLWDIRLEFEQIIGDDTPAWAVYKMVLDAFNAMKSEGGEVLFAADLQGTKLFNGDLFYEGSALGLLEEIANRSRTEFALRYELHGALLVPFLMVSDRFEVPGGATFKDGDDATIVGSPRYTRDTTLAQTTIILVGQSTNIGELVPDWATWGVHEIEPQIVMSIEPDDPDQRQRTVEETHVDWTLSHAELQRLADLTVQTIRDMFYTHIYAHHTEQGKPWHEGWAYIGPPDELEPQLTKDKWNTSLRLAEMKKQPVSLVMRSGPKSKINLQKRLVVGYNRVTGEQSVQIVSDGLIDLGQRWTAVLTAGKGYRLWVYSGGKYIYPKLSIVGAGQTIEVGAPFNGYTPEDEDYDVTYRYGGGRHHRGVFRFIKTTKVRTSPYIQSGNVAYTAAVGDEFSARQGTYTGSSVDGSRVWRGNVDGTRWAPEGSMVFVRHHEAILRVVRQIMDGQYEGLWVQSNQLANITPVPGDGLTFITKIYDFEEPMIAIYDPRRDGIGVWGRKLHVNYGAESTASRWHRVSWSAGEASSSLDNGITDSETEILVQSSLGFPTPPFRIAVGDINAGQATEAMTVTSTAGPLWTVTRGINGTDAIIHEGGEDVILMDPPPWDGFVFDWSWVAGERYAAELLAELQHPFEQLDFEALATTDGIALGSLHDVEIETEGPWGTGIQTQVRVIGYARDSLAGTVGLVVEVVHE